MRTKVLEQLGTGQRDVDEIPDLRYLLIQPTNCNVRVRSRQLVSLLLM